MIFIQRWLKLTKLKVLRQKDSIHSIAWGAVIGLMVGMIIPMGGQTIIALTLAWMFGANKIAAGTFTFISNPWSVVFIYPFQIMLGHKLVGGSNGKDIEALTSQFIEACKKVEVFSFEFSSMGQFFNQHGWDIMIYFVVGGFVIGVIVSAITYPLITRAARRHAIKRQERIKHRAEKRAEKLRKMIADGEVPEVTIHLRK